MEPLAGTKFPDRKTAVVKSGFSQLPGELDVWSRVWRLAIEVTMNTLSWRSATALAAVFAARGAAAATPAPPGPTVAMPPGQHLKDGEYISDPEEFQWGAVQVKVTIHAGAITDVAFLQMPGHREVSIELSAMSKPILISEAIQKQTALVHIVASASFTSLAFQAAMADTLKKATR
ncbi:MAG: FMN-binding protein [Rhizomicrobium sp.]